MPAGKGAADESFRGLDKIRARMSELQKALIHQLGIA